MDNIKLLTSIEVISITILIVTPIASVTLEVYAQSLGKVFFEEKGKITGQKPLERKWK